MSTNSNNYHIIFTMKDEHSEIKKECLFFLYDGSINTDLLWITPTGKI